MPNTILEIISEFIHLNFVLDGRHLTVDDPLIDGDEEVIDSGAMLEVVLFLEEQFDVTIDDDDVTPEHFGSIASMAACVKSKLTRQQTGPLGVR